MTARAGDRLAACPVRVAPDRVVEISDQVVYKPVGEELVLLDFQTGMYFGLDPLWKAGHESAGVTAPSTTWFLAEGATGEFFETFILCPHRHGYAPLHPQYGYLYNSYYEAIGERVARPERGLMTRPSLDEVREYRAHVDRQLLDWLSAASAAELAAVAPLVETGMHHEQQHQELILTDLKHLLSLNPLRPVYRKGLAQAHPSPAPAGSSAWISFPGGVVSIVTVKVEPKPLPLLARSTASAKKVYWPSPNIKGWLKGGVEVNTNVLDRSTSQ